MGLFFIKIGIFSNYWIQYTFFSGLVFYFLLFAEYFVFI